MPSTYSNLKIQLMATGENSTTWGNVTNINLGTAIEEAIAGSADVTFASNNQTLTLTDTNATQTARNMRLRCTGTTGGSTRNLVVPTIEKLYLTQNDCADAVVVKTAAGTGVTVPAGKTMWVYVDGTNVVDAVTHLSSLTLATVLPIASGGTGANTATDARTSLGLGSISTQNSNSVTITGGSISGITDLAVADGGTGASDAATARTNLGLGSISTQDSNSVNITGGSISGITDLAIADGGTGASDAAAARTNLGATTVGANLFTLTNPAAIRFVRLNADNTVSALSDTDFRTAIGAGTGTVTSVAASGGTTGLTFSGSPITTSGTLTLGGTLAVASGGTGASDAATARTNLGATTVGANLFTLTNPAAIRFVRLNADNTVSALSDTDFRTAIGAGTGTVTSVGGTGTVNGLTLTGTVTSSGSLTLGGTLSVDLSTATVTGTLPVARGGTGVTTSTGTTAVVLSNSPTLVTPTLGAASATSIANGLGAVGTPAYTFTGDLNTGMWSPTADTVAVSTGGSERMRIDSAGDVGIGTTNPLFPLHVNGEVRGTKFTSDAASQSLADNTDLTVLTLTGVEVRLFLVSINTDASAGSDMTVALVAVGTDGSGGAESTVTQLANGANTDVTVANVAGTSTVSVKQTTGTTQTISWSITRIM